MTCRFSRTMPITSRTTKNGSTSNWAISTWNSCLKGKQKTLTTKRISTQSRESSTTCAAFAWSPSRASKSSRTPLGTRTIRRLSRLVNASMYSIKTASKSGSNKTHTNFSALSASSLLISRSQYPVWIGLGWNLEYK